MNRLKSAFLIAATFAAALPVMAGVSPHVTISETIDGSKVTLTYGRPYTKDPKSGDMRKIWGTLVPYGKVWRTGADAATTFTTEKDLMFGETEVPAGKYTLYTLPAADGSAKLIINKQTGQWGTQYDEKQDLARVDLKKEATDKQVDQFTMAIEKKDSGGVLKMMWENTQYSVPFTVKK
jgi:hypothetical protein